MCGVAGALVPGSQLAASDRVRMMLDGLKHRGPDGEGVARAGSAAVGMCRLRVRSAPEATIPFVLADGARAAYNGEVFESEGVLPRGGENEVAVLRSDIAHSADAMYACAILDGQGGIRLSRDRFGIKPLFIRTDGGVFTFASELPALLASGAPLNIDITALHELFAFGRTLDRRSLYVGVRELAPNETLFVRPDGQIASQSTTTDNNSAVIGEQNLRAELRASVVRLLASDRRVGVALSGGLDSTILAHELSAIGIGEIQTISLSLPDNNDGLSRLAEIGLGSTGASASWQHTTVPMCQPGYFRALDDAARRMREPFRMSSLPLYFTLGEIARDQDVTVLLLGEGADELFGGYNSYRAFDTRLSLDQQICKFYLGGTQRRYLAETIGSEALVGLDIRLGSVAYDLSKNRSPKQTLLAVERLLSLEPLLRRADHALMATGIEGRTPFLHGNVPAIAMSLADDSLWSSKLTKLALRNTYRQVLPTELLMKPKRALRAPSQLWRKIGVDEINATVACSRPLLSLLGINVYGIASIRRGCELGDPAAIPLAVAFISTIACLSQLAVEDRLADPDLSAAARDVARHRIRY